MSNLKTSALSFSWLFSYLSLAGNTAHSHCSPSLLAFCKISPATRSNVNSYFCRTVKDWNALPSEIVNIKSADRFKKVLFEYFSQWWILILHNDWCCEINYFNYYCYLSILSFNRKFFFFLFLTSLLLILFILFRRLAWW